GDDPPSPPSAATPASICSRSCTIWSLRDKIRGTAMEREWREASDLRSSLLSIGIVVLSGALLRCWSLRYSGLAPIEHDIVDSVVQLLHTGSYRPTALVRPTLPVYLQAAVGIVHFLWGATSGAWRAIAAFGPEQLRGGGRGCSA